MNDMSPVIVPKSDQINADDLIAGPITITISDVKISPGTEQPVLIHYQNDGGKVFRPCKSMCRVLVSAWGPDAKEYVGRSLTLYRDPTVKWGGLDVGGIRVSHMSHIDKDMVLALTVTRSNRKPFTVRPLKAEATRVAPKPADKPSAPPLAQEQPIDIDPAIHDYADMLEGEIDGAPPSETGAIFNAAIKTPEWAALRDADPGRAADLKAKAIAKAKGAGETA